MKKITLLALTLFISTTSFAQNVINLFAKANTFFELMATGKFDTAHSYFADSEKAKLKPENLKTAWDGIEARFGKAQEIGATSTKNQGEYISVLTTVLFERAEQDFNVVFNKQEKIMGFFPAQKAAQYTAPNYADTTLYTEKYITLTSGTHQLAAVVTKPKNGSNFPIVVLVHGSGPSDMDETIGPNKPFKDFAAGLASQGIAVLRYVKRTTVYGQEFTSSFTAKEEVLDDALAAVTLAKTQTNIDPKKIFVLGHSLGGMLAPRLATLSKDINGLILAAAPARKLADIIADQNKYMVEISGDTTATLKTSLQQALTEIEKAKLTSLGSIKPDSTILGLPAAYWVDLNTNDQVETAKKLSNKMMIVQGGMDFQVSKTDFDIWNDALKGKSNVTLKYYPELNHLFSIQMQKGTMTQYQTPDHISGQLISDIAEWIKAN